MLCKTTTTTTLCFPCLFPWRQRVNNYRTVVNYKIYADEKKNYVIFVEKFIFCESIHNVFLMWYDNVFVAVCSTVYIIFMMYQICIKQNILNMMADRVFIAVQSSVREKVQWNTCSSNKCNLGQFTHTVTTSNFHVCIEMYKISTSMSIKTLTWNKRIASVVGHNIYINFCNKKFTNIQ